MNKAEQADGDMPMPQDYLRLSMLKKVRVQVQTERLLDGILHAYDEHCNLILSDVTEHLLGLNEKGIKSSVSQRQIDLIYVRGDRIISIANL